MESTASAAPPPPPPPPTPTPPPGGFEPSRPSWPAITWMAATGGSLLLVAAVIFTVTNWATIPAGIKLAAMVGATASVVLAGERSARYLPLVSRVLQHLGAMLVGVAAASLGIGLGADWPETTLVAGLAGLVALGWQLGRRPAPVLDAAVPVAVTFALVGVAGRTALPLPLLLGLVAVVAVGFAGRDVLAGRLALLAGLTPLGVGASLLPIGAGTAVRLGLRGDVVTWSAPLTGLAAGAALAVVASRRRSLPHAVAALGAVLAGVLVGLRALEPHGDVWWVVAAVTVLATQIAAILSRRDTLWRRLTGPLADCGEWTLLVAAAGGALHAAALTVFTLVDWGPASDPTIAGAWAVVTLAASTVLLRPATDRILPDPAVHVIAGLTALAAAVVLAVPAPIVAVAAVLVLAAAVLGTGRAPAHAALAGVVATIASCVELVLETTAVAGPLHLVVVAVVAGLLVSAARRSGAVALPMLAAFLAASAGLATKSPADLLLAVGAAVAVALVCDSWSNPGGFVAWLVPVGGVLLRAGTGTTDLALTGAVWVTWGGLAVAALIRETPVASRGAQGRRTHLAAALLPGAALVTMAAAGVAAGTVAMVLAVAVVPLAGCAFTAARVTPLDTVTVATAVMALVLSSTGADARVSGFAVLVSGALAWLYGQVRCEVWLRLAGLAGTGLGLALLVEGFAVGQRLLRWGAPYGVTGNDLAVLTLAAVLLAAGATLAGRGNDTGSQPSSWLTAGPGLGLAGWHVLVQLAVTGEGWRAALGVVLGAAAVGWGGARRLVAPLLLGTVLLAGTIVIGARDSLTSLPIWVWLAAGGAVLLALAIVVERRNRVEPPATTGRRALATILDDYR